MELWYNVLTGDVFKPKQRIIVVEGVITIANSTLCMLLPVVSLQVHQATPSNTAVHDQTEQRSHDTIIIVLLLVV